MTPPEESEGGDRGTGRDPEVALPLAISALVMGVIGLSVPALAWVSALMAVGAYLLDARTALTRTLAIIGGSFAVVGIASTFIG